MKSTRIAHGTRLSRLATKVLRRSPDHILTCSKSPSTKSPPRLTFTFLYQNVACIADVIQRAPYPYDVIHIYYNHFVNSISQKVKKLEIMSRPQFLSNFKRLSIHETDEPENEFSSHYFYELYVAGKLIRSSLSRNVTECCFWTNISYERYGKRVKERSWDFARFEPWIQQGETSTYHKRTLRNHFRSKCIVIG